VSAHHRLGRLHSSCEFDSRCEAFPVFFVKIRTLYIGLVHQLKPKARTAFTACSKLARTPRGSASNLHLPDETAPGPGPCLLNFTVAIASGLKPLESVRHPIATVYSLYCNKGRLGFYCDLET
jgi:hypothetical protein